MRLLRLLSLPYARKHRARTLLTVFGIALGVAVLVAVQASNQAVLAGLRQTVTAIAGAAELQVSAGDTGIPEEILDRVQAVPEVGRASPAVEAVVSTGLPGEGNLLVLGVDLTVDQGVRDYGIARIDDPLVFLAQPDSIILSDALARRHGLAPGGALLLETAEGRRPFRVRGLFGNAGFARAFGGNLAVMDVYAAQQAFGRGRVFDRIDVAVRPGAAVEDCRRALEAALGPALRVDTPSERRRYFEQVLANYRAAMELAGSFALIVGLFLIQNTFVVAVAERRSEIGILRALGATRAQVRNLFLAEGGCLGLAGALAGAAGGAALARLATGYVARSLEGLYGLRGQPLPGGPDTLVLAAAVVIGLACGVFAAVVPAAAAARADAVRALGKARYEMIDHLERRWRRRLAALAAALAVLLFLPGTPVAFEASYVLAAIALVALMPELAGTLIRLARPLLLRVRPVEGALAADSLLRAPRHTASVAAALMLTVSMVIGLAGIAEASYAAIARWAEGTLDADFLVAPSQNPKDFTFRFPAAMENDLAGIPGLAVVQPVRTARVSVGRSQPILLAVDIGRLSPRARRSAVPVNTEEVHRLAAEGRGVIVSSGMAAREGLRAGDLLDLPAPGETLRLPVLATYTDFTDPQGTVVIDRSLYRARWHDDTVNLFRLYLRPGAEADAVRAEVLRRCGSARRLFVFSSGELRRYILGLAYGWFRLTWAQLAVAILVAVLGIAGALTVSIAGRRRELGILRVVGGLEGQVRVAVGTEAALVAGVGFVLGAAFSVVNISYGIAIWSGHALEFRFPVAVAAGLLPLLLAAALVAAVGPARAVLRGPLAAAVEYE
jgi:putative ABC transport system permease protein